MARIVDWLRLSRAPLAPTAAFDAIACAWLARGPGLASGAEAIAPGELASLAGTSLLVFAAGMIGNDWADRATDRTIHPERPIPSGRISPALALAVAIACAAAAIALGGGPVGSRAAVAVAVLSAAAYDLVAKHSAVAAPLAMAVVRASNAAVGVVPLLAAGTTSWVALGAPLLLGAYSAGITVLSVAEDLPSAAPRRLVFARATSFLAFAGAAVLSMWGAQGLTFGALLAATVCISVAAGRTPRTTAFTTPASVHVAPSDRKRAPVPVRVQVLELLLGLYWLEAILANGARPGHDGWFTISIFGAAFAAILSSQLAIRALRARA